MLKFPKKWENIVFRKNDKISKNEKMFFHFPFFRNFIIFWKSSKKNKNGTQLGFNSDLDSCVPPPGLSPYDIDEYLCCFFRKSPSRKRFRISWRTTNKVLFGRTNPGRQKSGTPFLKNETGIKPNTCGSFCFCHPPASSLSTKTRRSTVSCLPCECLPLCKQVSGVNEVPSDIFLKNPYIFKI